MTLLRLALAALFACALAVPADARTPNNPDRGGHGHQGGHGHGGGKGGPEPAAPSPAAAPEPSSPAGPGSAGDGSGANARGHFRLFCDRWRDDYWCKAGEPYVLAPGRK